MTGPVRRALATVALAGALAVATGLALVPGATAAGGEDPHLPEVVNAPGAWSTHEGVDGPVAAMGISMRSRTVGVLDKRQSLEVFAVSAADGSASWLRLPGFSHRRWGLSGGTALSPDGRWIGWVRPARDGRGGMPGNASRWSVMDTTTGEIRQLDVPGASSVRGTLSDLAFSGDSRYLLTSYEDPDLPRRQRSHEHQLVAWDVRDGSPTVVEEPGHYWLPVLGTAPSGVVWARGRTVHRTDPDLGAPSSVRLPYQVMDASWGPDDTTFASIGHRVGRPRSPWRLYAGAAGHEADARPLDLPAGVSPGQLLGWRDPTHVVVGHWRTEVHVVDIVDGDVEAIELRGYGEQVNAPDLATALWQRPLGPAAEPEATTDPRRPWHRAGAVALVPVAGSWLLWRRRRRRVPSGGRSVRRPPGSR
ncbi:hypothetical protein H5V45_12875 [Nocardioides sp. KIGAM211]|uniref:WD40 repeat domain-containing protein n=1 Tax=Nocardioides luti TaxID=2761101 RepID=A0A7X0VBA9_9ACTN|nr:hypothetical protein [Nocardioides luti]MBB6628215.1 hypothetical protein [Nocardioides luti]